jgi:hypothetical protein
MSQGHAIQKRRLPKPESELPRVARNVNNFEKELQTQVSETQHSIDGIHATTHDFDADRYLLWIKGAVVSKSNNSATQ